MSSVRKRLPASAKKHRAKGLAKGAHSRRPRPKDRADLKAFHTLFSHSGAAWLTGIIAQSVRAAKARLAELGISPEDPSSENEDPRFKLS